MMSIAGYCIPRAIKIQKLIIFPYFYPQTAQPNTSVNRGVFRPNVQNIQTFVLSKRLMRLQQILHSDKEHKILVVPKICPTDPKWRTAAILKKWINCYISPTVWFFFMKFCTLTHIGPPNPKKYSKNQFLTNPRWRTAAILKNVKCDISAAVRHISMKFGRMMHLSPPYRWENKNWKIEKSKMADGGHLENQKIAISQKPFGRFLRNFAWCHILVLRSLPADHKINFFINPRWRTAPAAILKIEKLLYLQNLLVDFAEILYNHTY